MSNDSNEQVLNDFQDEVEVNEIAYYEYFGRKNYLKSTFCIQGQFMQRMIEYC